MSSTSPEELDRVLKQIAGDLRRGTIIPFLGAAASLFDRDVARRPPGGADLARRLARDFGFPDYKVMVDTTDPSEDGIRRRVYAEIACGDLSRVSSWVASVEGDRGRIQERLRDDLADPDLEPNRLHLLIADVAFDRPIAVITTNYDTLMEKALEIRKVPHDLFVIDIDREKKEAAAGAVLLRLHGDTELKPRRVDGSFLDLPIGPDGPRITRTVVFKIHGHIDRDNQEKDSFVITEEDYVLFLGRMGPGHSIIPKDLLTILARRRLLFLGYGLRDWNLRVLLDAMRTLRGRREMKSYAFTRGLDLADDELWKTRGVNVYGADLNDVVPRLREHWRDAPPAGRA